LLDTRQLLDSLDLFFFIIVIVILGNETTFPYLSNNRKDDSKQFNNCGLSNNLST